MPTFAISSKTVSMEFNGKYLLQSPITGEMFEDQDWLLEAPMEKQSHLLRTVFRNKQLEVDTEDMGIYRFASWLPILRILAGSFAPVTYRSTALARHLGLRNLFITFSGYWPEKGIRMKTCSLKETEAYSVCARLDPLQKKILVVASAGNTARAFAQVCSDNRIPLLLCVPRDNINALWFEAPLHPCVILITTPSGCDYFDAIHLSNKVCGLEGFIPEGGAKNVARRDGMGTTVLSAAHIIGHIPDYYFQAVGSGTGAIAAWEANIRLIGDGRFGNHKMQLVLSQNAPFQPMVDAWKANQRDLFPMEDDTARELIQHIDAKVLSNRKPPYSITGGLFDALKDTSGIMMSCTNEEAKAAALLFDKMERIDIHPAAAIATASLIRAISDKLADPSGTIMLNITGGGEKRFFKDNKELFYLQPTLEFDVNCTHTELEQKLSFLAKRP